MSRSTGSHSATEDKRARTPMVSSYGVIPVGGCRIVVLSVVLWFWSLQLSCVMSEGKGSHTSSSNEGKGRMLRLRHSSSNSLRVGLTKLNLLVGWCSWVLSAVLYVLIATFLSPRRSRRPGTTRVCIPATKPGKASSSPSSQTATGSSSLWTTPVPTTR